MTTDAETRVELPNPIFRIAEDVRVIKSWVSFMGIVTLIGFIIGIICGIVIAVSVHSANVNNQNNTISNCQSLGGTDPSC